MRKQSLKYIQVSNIYQTVRILIGNLEQVTLDITRFILLKQALYTLSLILEIPVNFSCWDQYILWGNGSWRQVISHTCSSSKWFRRLQSASSYKANLNMNISYYTSNSKQPQRKVIYSEGIDLCQTAVMHYKYIIICTNI